MARCGSSAGLAAASAARRPGRMDSLLVGARVRSWGTELELYGAAGLQVPRAPDLALGQGDG
eukprot:1161686-Pelagomonas_calceolata.AAC.10